MTNKIEWIALEQGSPEWLEYRIFHRNASETAVVMGKSPFMSPKRLAEIKLGISDQFVTQPMKDGIRYEAKARQEAIDFFGLDFAPAVCRRGKYSASLDGTALDDDLGRINLEVKVPADGIASPLWAMVASDELPEHYRLQVAHQEYSSDAGSTIFVVYDFITGKFEHTTISTDKNRFLEMADPAWTEFEATLATVEQSRGIRETAAWINAEQEYLAAKGLFDEAKQRLDFARQWVIALSGSLGVKGRAVSSSHYERAGGINYKQACIDHKIDLDQYRGSPSWVWRVDEVNGKNDG